MAVTLNNQNGLNPSLFSLNNNSKVRTTSDDSGVNFEAIGKTRDLDARAVAEKSKSQVLNQEDFLKLLTTQLAHQDPTEPMDNSQMVTQMSQLSMVEGLNSVNTGMADIIAAVSSSSALSASTLVGRSVLVESKKAFFDGKNAVTAKIDAGKGYGDIKIVVKDQGGNIVSEYTAPGGKGKMDFSWDGVKKPAEGNNKAELYPAGMYTVEAVGTDLATGKPTALPVSVYAVVGSVTLGKTHADTMLNLIGFGDVALKDIKEVAL